ncbi:MAG: hypothetical protein AB8B69_11075 [Chitinophagales bacterium]
MKKTFLLLFLIASANLFTHCNSSTTQSSNTQEESSLPVKQVALQDSIHKEYVDADPNDFKPTECELFFDEVMIYKFTEKNGISEHWIYFNPKTQYLLYTPQDEMVNAIVSHTDGSYWIFGTGEDGKKTAHKQQIDDVADERLYDANADYPNSNRYITYTPTDEQWDFKDKIGVFPSILSDGYQMKDRESAEPGSLYLTTQIPIENTYQLYGFSQIEGDSKLPWVLNGIGEFSKQQLLTKYEQKSKWGDLFLELKSYSFTSHYLNVCDYTYYEQKEGSFVEVKNPFAAK